MAMPVRVAVAAALAAFVLCAVLVHAADDVDSNVVPVITEEQGAADAVIVKDVADNAAVGALSCQWTDPSSGASFDLSPLAKSSGDWEGADQEPVIYNYKMNFCGKSNAGSGCTDKDGSVCRVDRQTAQPNMVFGSYVTSPLPEYALLEPGNPSKGLQITFKNGEKCGGMTSMTRTVLLRLFCGSSNTQKFVVHTQTGACAYSIEFTSPNACPSSKTGGGLSGGSVFLILFFVGGFVYVAGGCLYKRKQLGTTGMESCPNYAQWKELPSLVMDGWRFTKRKVCGPKDGFTEMPK